MPVYGRLFSSNHSTELPARYRLNLPSLNLYYLVISFALGLNYSQLCGISLSVSYKASEMRQSDLNVRDSGRGDP